MRASTATILFLVAAAPAWGQMSSPFSRMFLARGGGNGATSSSSFTSFSSSWASGADGQMHQETHEVRRETTRDFETGEMMQRQQSEVNCKDGNCQKMVQLQAPAPRFHERMMARFMPSIQGMRGMTPSGLHHMAPSWAFAHPPVIQQEPLVIAVHFAPTPVFLAPRTYAEARPKSDAEAYKFKLGGGAAFATVAAFVAIGALLKCHRGSVAKAREHPIRDLAQPLAPEREAQMKCGSAVRAVMQNAAPKTNTEARYLSRVYKQAAEISEMRMTRAYLSRVYSNVIG